ncbi:hypothetical protein AAG570_002178 [Ranatra chinensis]|uniref:Alpha-2-macroglobulin receptor-associated protein n=1 Tax=Ranatra chinensis TaxID=642074 RepID=A0ABD0Y6T1_9HEMI
MRSINRPFRMAKLNMLWTKAQVRLTEPKLKSLYSELKMHEKEELAFKRIKADGLDKEGLKEADIRKKLIGIMSTYGLLEHYGDISDPAKYREHEALSGPVSDKYLNKSLFKDKKLNKLWEKVENAGFNAEELSTLKEEFIHHQDKIDGYYSILDEVEAGDKDQEMNEKLERFNAIEYGEENEKPKKDFLAKVNSLRDKHREIRDDYDRLYRLAMQGPNSQEFVEPKVQGLWKLALASNFSLLELESLKAELFHYEKRLLKLRHLHVDAAMQAEKRKEKGNSDKLDMGDITEDMIKKHTRKVSKLHTDIESRIMNRHVEL